MKYLILAPHTDDGEFGAGASIAKLIEEGHEIYYVAFSICEESVPEGLPKDILADEVKASTQQLGIKQSNLKISRYKVRKFPEFRQEILEDLVQLNKEIQPNTVFLPSSTDIHQDHKTIYEEGVRAFKRVNILGYELVWNNFSFATDYFMVVNRDHINKKVKAIKEYKSQQDKFYTSNDMVESLAKIRGLQIFSDFAESFEAIRLINR